MKKLGTQGGIILFLSVVTAVSLCVAVWAVFFRPVPGQTDYALAELEPNAVSYENKTEKKEQDPSTGGSVSIQYKKQVRVDAASKTAAIYYANPSDSGSSVILQLVLTDHTGQDVILGSSGLIQPGTKLETLTLENVDCPPDSYEGKFVLTFYDMASGEKAILNTVIDGLKVVVK